MKLTDILEDLEKKIQEKYYIRKKSCTQSDGDKGNTCLLYTSPSPRDVEESRMPSSA